ncbi:DUF4126 domain-containing protein [Sphingomonas sp. GC_Shp_1]|uniref:DUF4126 domain-containing protein n=1 Tax=unclassified Sphingomonas TaxID=196159 RepID=UPI00226AE5AE
MIVLALVVGIIAGLRAAMALVAVSWAAALGRLDLSGSWLAFLGWRYTPWIVSLLAIGELITDQLPSTPSRKVPAQFGARVIAGGVAGGAIGIGLGTLAIGIVLGVVGAVIGTYGGAALRSRLAAAFGRDLPAALIEDVIAILAAVLVVQSL